MKDHRKNARKRIDPHGRQGLAENRQRAIFAKAKRIELDCGKRRHQQQPGARQMTRQEQHHKGADRQNHGGIGEKGLEKRVHGYSRSS